MAKFSDTAVAPIATAVTAKEGIVDTSLGVEDNALAQILPAITSNITTGIEAFVEQKEEGVLSKYAVELGKIASAVDQGKIKRKQALTRSRALFSSFVEDNPGSAGDISTLHSRMLNTAGLAQMIGQTTPDEKFDESQRQSALKAGFVDPETGEADLGAFEDFQLQNRIASVQNQKNANLIQQIQLEKARFGQLTAVTNARLKASERQQTELLTKASAASIPKTVSISALIFNDYQKSQQDPTGNGLNEALAKFSKAEADIRTTSNQFRANVDGGIVDALEKTHLDIIDVYRDMVKGTITAEVMKARKETIEAQGIVMAYQNNPDTLKYYAASYLGKGMPAQLVPQFSVYLDSMFNSQAPAARDWRLNPEFYGHGNVFNNPDKNATDTYWTVLENFMKQANTDPDERASKEAVNNLFGLFKNLERIDTTELKPQAYRQMNKFFASDGFGSFMEKSKGQIPEFMGKKSKDIIERQLDTMFRTVKSVWMNTSAEEVVRPGLLAALPSFSGGRVSGLPVEGLPERLTTKKPLSHSVEVVFDGAAAVFRPISVTPSTQDLEVSESLNKTVGVMLNNSVRIRSHIAGHKNYQATYNAWFKPQLDLAPKPAGPTTEETPVEPGVSKSTQDSELGKLLASVTPSVSTNQIMTDLISVESGGDDSAVSSKGAVGVTQIMEETGKDPGFGITPIDVKTASKEERIAFTQQYLDVAQARFGSLALALASYNAGIPAIDKWVAKGTGKLSDLPKETQGYLKKFAKRGTITLEEFN